MGLFRSKNSDAPNLRAATGIGRIPGLVNSYSVGAGVDQAMSIPTVARAVGLITSTIGALEFRSYSKTFDPTSGDYTKNYLPDDVWMNRPDPETTRQFLVSNTVRELMMFGRSFWAITQRQTTGYPAAFQWLPYGSISTPDQVGEIWTAPAQDIYFNGVEIDPANVVQFYTGMPGMLSYGKRAIEIALSLDKAAQRFATVEIPAGYLQVKPGGEQLSADELEEIASGWAAARRENTVGILNELLSYEESSINPSTLQLSDGRATAALEISRIAQVPAWLVGIAVGGLTYQNSEQARRDLYLFGAKPYVDAIEQTLSAQNVSPRGRYVEMDILSYIGETESLTVEPETETIPND